MYTKTSFSAAVIAVAATLISAKPFAGGNSVLKPVDEFTFFKGNGTKQANWPTSSNWSNFDDLWEANLPLIRTACTINNAGPDNSEEEIALLKKNLLSITLESDIDVDQRVALALMMQESQGCVRMPTTGTNIKRPGLFQSPNGAGTCAGLDSCSESMIVQMIRDGLAGTPDDPGFASLITKAGTDLGQFGELAVYGGSRLYNSGSVNPKDMNDNRGVGSKCYCVEVANRLQGWTFAPSTCK